MKLLGINDLAKRWNYTRQGVHKKMQTDKDFPLAIATINKATLVFSEEQRKELRDSNYKYQFSQRGFQSCE